MPTSTRRQAQARSRITNDGSPAIETPTAQMANPNDHSIQIMDQDMQDLAQDEDEDEEGLGKPASHATVLDVTNNS